MYFCECYNFPLLHLDADCCPRDFQHRSLRTALPLARLPQPAHWFLRSSIPSIGLFVSCRNTALHTVKDFTCLGGTSFLCHGWVDALLFCICLWSASRVLFVNFLQIWQCAIIAHFRHTQLTCMGLHLYPHKVSSFTKFWTYLWQTDCEMESGHPILSCLSWCIVWAGILTRFSPREHCMARVLGYHIHGCAM